MRKFVLFPCLCILAGAAGATTITYSVEASWTGTPGLSTSTATDNLTATSGSDVLTLDFVPIEPGGPVGSPTNTSWGSLYLEDTDPPSTGYDDFSFTGLTLTLLLTDVSTGESVTYTGTLSGGYVAAPGNSGNESNGEIAWSPTGVQTLLAPSTVTFLTDSSDSIGVTLDDGSFTSAATTVNGTVANAAGTAPEPATLAMMGSGLLALGLVIRRRKQN